MTMTQIHQASCTFNYLEFNAGLHLPVQNVWGITFMGHSVGLHEISEQHVNILEKSTFTLLCDTDNRYRLC